MLRARIATALVAIPFLLWLIFQAPVWFLNAFVLLIAFIAIQEFSTMALKAFPGGPLMATIGGMSIAIAMGLGGSGLAVSLGIVICLVVILLGTLASGEDNERSVHMAGQILLGSLYGGVLLPHFIWVRALPDDGPAWVVMVLGCVMAGDAGGYFGGRWFGKNPLWPQVSPNKTVEGAVASFLCSVVVGFALNAWLLRALGPAEVIFVAGIINILAQLGDLLESMLKRAYDVSDSGWIIPGHGGVLDRTDSLVLPIVFVYYYAILTQGYVSLTWSS